ncbi:hypothetical protein ELK83_26475 [Klebsiella pneumoniae]|nr:hypothetical protein [Klebsiella pneumoniae]MBL2872242.1 hypothetical protein [Klebsiella pneumoniae]
MGSCAAPSAKGDDKFITTDYLQQCRNQPGGQLTRHRQQLDQVAHFVRTKSGDAMRNLGGNPPRLRDFFNVERAFSCHSRPFWPIILIKKTGHPPRSIPENSDDPHS